MYNYTFKVYSVQPFSSMALLPWTGAITFKKTLSLAKISTGIRITNEIGSWYGDISFVYHSEDINDVIEWDMIKIYKGSTCIYYGRVTGRTINLNGTAIDQTIDCKGFQIILNDFYYSNSWFEWYKLYMPLRSNANDFSVNNNNGTLYNGSFTKTIQWLWVYLPQPWSYIQIPHSASFAVSDFTIAMYIKITNMAWYKWLLSKTQSNIPAPFDAYIDWSGYLTFLIWNGSFVWWAIVSLSTLSVNTEYSIVLIKYWTTMQIYINWVLDISVIVGWTMGDTWQPVRIWNRNDGVTPFTWYISNVILDDNAWNGWQVSDFHNRVENFVFTKNTEPAKIIQDILFQSWKEYIRFNDDYSSISAVGTNYNISFDKSTLSEALKKVLSVSSYYYIVKWDWKAFFAPYSSTASHNFTFKNDIRSITFETSIDDLVNDVDLIHGAGTSTGFDADNMYIYWTKKKIINDSEIKDSSTGNEYINTYLNENAIRKDTIKVVVNSNYSIETIYPWQMINISNCPVEIKDKIIKRVEITDKGATLYLNTKETIEKSLYKLIS